MVGLPISTSFPTTGRGTKPPSCSALEAGLLFEEQQKA
jgi:hypothetical protein